MLVPDLATWLLITLPSEVFGIVADNLIMVMANFFVRISKNFPNSLLSITFYFTDYYP
jgi:hypothetical protein